MGISGQSETPIVPAGTGEGGIRTRGTSLNSYDGLANRCLKPLGHLSSLRNRPACGSLQKSGRIPMLVHEVKSGLMICGLYAFFLLALNALINLFAMYGNFLRRIDADANLVTLYTQHSNGDLVTNHEGFTDPTRKY
mgnify:CR=1 FL=1